MPCSAQTVSLKHASSLFFSIDRLARQTCKTDLPKRRNPLLNWACIMSDTPQPSMCLQWQHQGCLYHETVTVLTEYAKSTSCIKVSSNITYKKVGIDICSIRQGWSGTKCCAVTSRYKCSKHHHLVKRHLLSDGIQDTAYIGISCSCRVFNGFLYNSPS